MPQRRNYAVAVLSPDKPPHFHVNMSTDNPAKAAKSMFLPYSGKVRVEFLPDVGTMYWRETPDKSYEPNKAATELTADKIRIAGQAIIVGMPKTKDRHTSLNAEIEITITNVYNTVHGLPLVTSHASRTSSKRPNKPKPAFEYFLMDEKKRLLAKKEDCDAEVVRDSWEQLEDEEKTKYVGKAEADLKRFNREMDEYKAKVKESGTGLEHPKHGRSAWVLWGSENSHMNQQERARVWKGMSDEDKEKWNQEAAVDKVRYDKEMVGYTAKLADFEKFQASTKTSAKRHHSTIDVVGDSAPKRTKSILKPEPQEDPSSSDSSSSDEDETVD
jgi:hypothetical protein